MLHQEEYEVKIHIYDGNEDSLPWFQRNFLRQKEQYLNLGREGNVNAKVLSYFFDGMALLVEGDIFFWEGHYLDAQDRYSKAIRELKLFLSSRSVHMKLDRLCERILVRTEGNLKLSQAMLISDYNQKHTILSEALMKYNEEVRQCSEMMETLSSFIAFSRALFTEALLWQNRAKMEEEKSTADAKRSLMKSRTAIRQATYINAKMKNFMEEIEEQLDDLTRHRILIKAETLGNFGTEASEKANYMEAKEYFLKAMLFYNRAAQLAPSAPNRRVLLAMSTVMEASAIECDANENYKKQDNMQRAAENFSEAAQKIDKAIALIGSLGTKELRDSFNAQRDYYLAMALLCEGTLLYDKEQYIEAKAKYEEAGKLFENSIKLAEFSETDTIKTLAQASLNDVKTYIQLCETFL